MSGFGLSDLGALGLISFGEFLWSLLIIFFMIIFFIILFTVIVDIFRSDDLGGWGKAGWAFFIIVLPFLGLFIYLICIAVPLRLILTFFEVPHQALLPEITTLDGAVKLA